MKLIIILIASGILCVCLLWFAISFHVDFDMFNYHRFYDPTYLKNIREPIQYNQIRHFLRSVKFEGGIRKPYVYISIHEATSTELSINYRETFPGFDKPYKRYHIQLHLSDYIRYRIDLLVTRIERQLRR